MPTKRSSAVAEPKSMTKNCDESFVVDERAALRPSECVQTKLLNALPTVAVPVSSLHTRRETRQYRS